MPNLPPSLIINWRGVAQVEAARKAAGITQADLERKWKENLKKPF